MTPRTRLQTKPASHFSPMREVVPVEFAIGLEMELNAAQTTLQSIAKALGLKSTFREDLLRQIQTLRA